MRIDELELAWDDETDRGRPRRHRAGGGGRGRTAIALTVTLLILGLIVGGLWYGFNKVGDFFTAADYDGAGHGEVTVEVKINQTATDIAQELQAKDVVKSAKAFVEAAKDNPRSKEIQPGFYKLRLQMQASEALALLLDRSSRVVSKVTLQEGLTYKETFAKLAEVTSIPVAEFEAAAKDPIALGVPDFWFNRFDKKAAAKSVEGFLWPDTYEFNPGETAETILRRIIQQFLDNADTMNLVKTAESKNISPFAALMTASLVEAEAGTQADMSKVARVVYNRLDKSMALEFDSTTNYWRELQGQERKHNLNDTELLDPNNPYRTYGVTGLPPGPIGNPGKAALEAALNPAPGNWLFFVKIDKAGNSAFTDSYDQHVRNIEEAKRNGAY